MYAKSEGGRLQTLLYLSEGGARPHLSKPRPAGQRWAVTSSYAACKTLKVARLSFLKKWMMQSSASGGHFANRSLLSHQQRIFQQVKLRNTHKMFKEKENDEEWRSFNDGLLSKFNNFIMGMFVFVINWIFVFIHQVMFFCCCCFFYLTDWSDSCVKE